MVDGQTVNARDTIIFPAPSSGKENLIEYLFYDPSETKQLDYGRRETHNQESLSVPSLTDGGITYNCYKVECISTKGYVATVDVYSHL